MTDTITRAIITDAIVNGVAAWKRNDAAAMDQAIDTAVDAIRDGEGPSQQDQIDAVWSLLIEAGDEDPKWTAEKIVATLAQKDTQNG